MHINTKTQLQALKEIETLTLTQHRATQTNAWNLVETLDRDIKDRLDKIEPCIRKKLI